MTANRVRTWQRARRRQPLVGFDATADFLSQLEDSTSELAHRLDLEHDRHVFGKLLSAIEPDFEVLTWRAFHLFALEGQKASEVAAELGLTENAVLLAKSRILKRLRDESAGLLD